MNRKEATQSILEAKQQKGVSFEEIAAAVGRHKVWTTSALLGQATMTKEESERAVERLGLGADVAEALQQIPLKGSLGENSARGSANLSLP
jgi:cyanate lyase